MNRTSLLLSSVILLCSTAPSQAASSPTHVLSSHSFGPGARCQTGQHILRAAIGGGVIAEHSSSGQHTLAGGFTATLDVQTSGSPWLTAATPRFVTLLNQANVMLHGTELDLGTQPSVKIGSLAAQVTTRVRERIGARLPIMTTTGWQPVEVKTSAGTTVLPRGIGVLPMIYTDPAPASGVFFDVVFHGSPGDLVLWVLGVAPTAAITVPGIHSTFGINPAFLLSMPSVGIVQPDGRAAFTFPAPQYATGSLYAQAIFSTTNPNYGPFAFSNAIRL